ncbi:MAG: phytoene desaturase family protein [Anaerolineales bacterium]
MADYDILVVGAGHNALVCAAYLAQAGYAVGVVERRHKVGGAVVTEEHIPGFHFDLGGAAHMLINHTPIVKELGLTAYGLAYIDVDPIFFAPFPDGSHIMVWQDVDKTCESIAAFSPQDAEAYRRFYDEWYDFSQAMVDAFLSPPTPTNMLRDMVIRTGVWRHPEWAPIMARDYGSMLRKTFSDERTRAMVGWMAAQSGPPPAELLAAPTALWHPMYHVGGVKRPRGGSGMLTQALAKMIQVHNGTIHVDSPVARILTSGGRAVGIETESGERMLAKKAVVSGAHIHRTLGMLGDEAPPKMRRFVEQKRLTNGLGMIVRYAMRELPDYLAAPGTPGPQHHGLQFVCPSLDYLDKAYADFKAGIPSREPALAIMTSSAIDPTLAPEGQHVLWLWGQYYPYHLSNGETWEDIGKREGDRMLALLNEYAPGIQDAVIGELIETPVYLEETLGLVRGHIMHLEMRGDQMFMFRPTPRTGQYRGPLDGLYLTGASTHPGGGIMGAAGRNAAHVIRRDLEGRRLFKLGAL